MSIKLQIGITVEDEFYSKETIKTFSYPEIKMLLSFIGSEKELLKVAEWHSEEAVDYTLELLRSCS